MKKTTIAASKKTTTQVAKPKKATTKKTTTVKKETVAKKTTAKTTYKPVKMNLQVQYNYHDVSLDDIEKMVIDHLVKLGYKKTSILTLDIYYKASNADKLQDELDSYLNGESYTIDNKEENVRIMNNLFTLIAIFLYGFIIVISLIGITNIFNTITTNMELRKQEFAMLKSIGMTSKEFKRMIRLESLFMGIKSLLFGILIGIILSYLIYLSSDSDIPYKLPIVAIIISILIVFILISLIMKYSLNKINKQNTIETIRNENI